MAAPSGPRATFVQRFFALFLDGIVLGIVGAILRVIAGHSVGELIALAVGIGYYGYLEGLSGQTVGKRALGIRVVDLPTGGPIGFSRGVLRYFARILSTVVFLLGYFWMLWDAEKQTWHDKIAGSVVVPVSAFPVHNWPGGDASSAPVAHNGSGAQPEASGPTTETPEEELVRKFDDREKQWGG
jgi:uncharacterized RDD family membrane protein YckC